MQTTGEKAGLNPVSTQTHCMYSCELINTLFLVIKLPNSLVHEGNHAVPLEQVKKTELYKFIYI